MAFKKILEVRARCTTLRRLAEIQGAGGSAEVRMASMRHLRVATDRWQGWGGAGMECSGRGETGSGGVDVGLRPARIPYWRGGTSGSIVPGRQVARTTVTRIIETVMRSSATGRRRKEQATVCAGTSLRGLIACASGCPELIEGYIVARCSRIDSVRALPSTATSRQSFLVGGLC
jgi:hypothetical protein